MSRGERKAMMRRDHPALSLNRQCKVLSISRSSFYYAPKGESPENLALMRRIDELFLKYPFYGSRQMVRQLRRDGVCVGRHPQRQTLEERRDGAQMDRRRLAGGPEDLPSPQGLSSAAHTPKRSPGALEKGSRRQCH